MLNQINELNRDQEIKEKILKDRELLLDKLKTDKILPKDIINSK